VGRPQYSSVWRKGTAEWNYSWRSTERSYGAAHLDKLPLDVSVVRRTDQREQVRPELLAWFTVAPAAGWAGLPWRALQMRGAQSAASERDRWYTGVWNADARRESVRTQGLDPTGHRERCRELAAQGYRPAAIAVAWLGEGQPLAAASVWHRPVIPETAKEDLARRQAQAAVALLRMGRADPVWPLLRHQPDPRLRTYLLHLLSSLRTEPEVLLRRLEEETEVSARRALLLALGEFSDDQLPPGAQQPLIARLLQMYRDDPDPGIHSAVDWLLRQRWGQAAEVHKRDHELAGQPVGERQWYVNKQGQTLAVVQGPVEFLMGSPGHEPDRIPVNEPLHRKRIGRSFAIGTKEVTVAQWERFLRDHPEVRHTYTKRYSPEPDGPIISVTWHEALQYCNWLSAQEGIPEDQWCYPSIKEIEDSKNSQKGLKLFPDYLRRTGYRLPTEAEWEYACRAGAGTGRHYGAALEWLPHYAWYIASANDRTWPVGRLKPNDLGLFDIYGNVIEWCQDRSLIYRPRTDGQPSEDEEDAVNVTDAQNRVLRGGAVSNHATDVRSATRIGLRPALRGDFVGLRPARTCR
jgi:formylglycine-generating enzyme required for sulfatase activity